MLKLVWLIPVLPLLGFLFNFLLGKRLGLSERAISIVACGVILGSMLLTFGAFYEYHWSFNPANETRPYISSQEQTFPNTFTWLPAGEARNNLGQQQGALSDYSIEGSYHIVQTQPVEMSRGTLLG